MPLFFSDTKPRECCCGCSLTCGMWTLLVLCVLEVIGQFCYSILGGVIALVPVVTLLCSLLMKDSSAATYANLIIMYIWSGLYVLVIIAIPIFFALAGAIGIGLGISAGLVVIGGPFIYLWVGICYFFHEERKEEIDGGYNKA